MPTDHTETSILPAGEAPQPPMLLQSYRLQPTPPSLSPQMPFYHWKGIWDTVRTRKEDGKDRPVPPSATPDRSACREISATISGIC